MTAPAGSLSSLSTLPADDNMIRCQLLSHHRSFTLKKKPVLRTVSSRPLIVYAADRVPAASFQARPEGTIHLLFHLSVPPLHRPQIPVAGVVPLYLRATTYLNTAKLLHQARSLLCVSVRVTAAAVLAQRRPLLRPRRFCTRALRSSPLPFLIDEHGRGAEGHRESLIGECKYSLGID